MATNPKTTMPLQSELPVEDVIDYAIALEEVPAELEPLVRSMFQQESSSGKNTATSNAGAVGISQIKPATFNSVADSGWKINNPLDNARAGIRYLTQMYQQSGNDPRLAAIGYYGGPGAISKAKQGQAVSDPLNPNAPNTFEYADQVVARARGEQPLVQNRRGQLPTYDNILAQLTQSAAEQVTATQDKISADLDAANQKAANAKAIAQAYGLDPEQTINAGKLTGMALQRAQVGLIAEIAGLQQKQQSDPWFRVFDQLSGGKLSAPAMARINTLQNQAATLAKSLDNIQVEAAKQINIGESTIAAITTNQAVAMAKQAKAKGDEQAALYKLKVSEAADLAAYREESLGLRGTTPEDRQIKAELKKIDVEAKKAEIENVKQIASYFNTNLGDAIKLLKTYPHLAGENFQKPSVFAVDLKASKNLLPDDVMEAYRNAYAYGKGYASISPQDASLRGEQLRQARLARNMQVGEMQQAIYNDGRELTRKFNPYAANFYGMSKLRPGDEALTKEPVIKQAVNSTLFQRILKKNEGNSPDKIAVSDEEILNEGAALAARVGVVEAAQQVANYFKAAMAFNNSQYLFDQIGLESQKTYRVPNVSINQHDTLFTRIIPGMLGAASIINPLLGPAADYYGMDKAKVRRPQQGVSNTEAIDLSDPVVVQREILSKLVAEKTKTQGTVTTPPANVGQNLPANNPFEGTW